jgi:Tol biopolymer transport system component
MAPAKQKAYALTVVPLHGSGPERVVRGAVPPYRWSHDGKSITTVLTDGHGVSNIWAIPVWGGGAPKRLTNFEEDTILAFAWSPSGERLACVRANNQGSDVMLLHRQRSNN